jgi:hypothetical protein
MPSLVDAAAGAAVALLFWTALGFAVARRIFPPTLAMPIAPALGWAIHSAATLPIFLLLGFSSLTIIPLAAAALIASVLSAAGRLDPAEAADSVPRWAYFAAATLALAPTAAIAPEHVGDSVLVAEPIFDHAKIAMIDVMTRLGLPPVNPFFAELGARGGLAYYYLWYFSAAQLALPLGLTGWEADIAMTWFSAFASLTLLIGLACWFGQSRSAAILAVLLAATASLRFMIGSVFGQQFLDGLLAYRTGFAGWLFQSAWVPQHLMAATCVLIAMLLICRLAQRTSLLALACLVLVVVAGFESSAWIGGITFLLCALIASPILFIEIERSRRRRFVLGLAIAAVLSLVLTAPFLAEQIEAVRLRGGGAPVVFEHFAVLGNFFADRVRRILDFPAYWLLLLPVEFPATYVAGAITLITLLASRKIDAQRRYAVVLCTALAGVGLAIPWLLASTLGDNNDLAMRAVLPAALVLIVFTAAGLSIWLRDGRRLALLAAVGGLLLGLPEAAEITYGNVIARPAQPGRAFAQTPSMWEAVRRHTAPAERVANNPLYLAALTPWPVNLSWALLSNRSSCFAGRELALVYTALPATRREEIVQEFNRVFAGEGTDADVRAMATQFGCRVVLVTASDGAWRRDPFATSELYRLVDANADAWRFYRLNVP